MISRETAKQESSSPSDKAAGASSWSRLKDPRIVRVSRAFGGKDRHSKVCTVRGLRDRRVRLSVPTAIQLYDLQDRLGLNQPSKVVDWLLNAAKTEIDELPPLQFPQGGTFLSMLDNINQDKSKNVSSQTQERDDNWARTSLTHHSYVNQNPSSLLMNTSSSTSIPFNSFVRWDPSNLTLSHPPRSPNCSPPHQQPEDWHNFSLMAPLQPHHHHQVLVYQPAAGIAAAAAQPYFQSQISAPNAEFDMKQMNSYQTSSSPTVDESSTHFNMTANLLPSQNNDGGR